MIKKKNSILLMTDRRGDDMQEKASGQKQTGLDGAFFLIISCSLTTLSLHAVSLEVVI